jgi:hypothetical protein
VERNFEGGNVSFRPVELDRKLARFFRLHNVDGSMTDDVGTDEKQITSCFRVVWRGKRVLILEGQIVPLMMETLALVI